MKPLQSPEYLRTSLAAAMALGLRSGRFYRDARPLCVNLLLTYADGCSAGCKYCGLGTARGSGPAEASFIRVPWPLYPTDELVCRLARLAPNFRRVCVSMVTHRNCFDDTLRVLEKVGDAVDLPVSALIAPSAMPAGGLARLKRAGADMVGIGLDAASQRIFERLRPTHSWMRYWETIDAAIEAFGPHKASVHLIVGLGESDEELVDAVSRISGLGAHAHLFSFYPEPDSPMHKRPQPPLRRYRRMQLVRYLLQKRLLSSDTVRYDSNGGLISIDASPGLLSKTVLSGEPFLTNGCPSANGEPACNRPFANERPSQSIRNFPFPPDATDTKKILKQLQLIPSAITEQQ